MYLWLSVNAKVHIHTVVLSKVLTFFALRSQDRPLYLFFKNVLGIRPHSLELYRTAFTHRSATMELGNGHRVNNERLEFLGDAVLSAVVADYIYHRYPNKGEGFMTELRSKIVSRKNLNQLGRTIGLMNLIRYDGRNHGEFKSKEGDGVEALVGAIYLDKGYRCVRRVIVRRFLHLYMDIEGLSHSDWNYKSKLLDWGQQHKIRIGFNCEKVSSKGHMQYDVYATVDGQRRCHAVANSIKEGEQLAAEKTFLELQKEEELHQVADS